MTVVAPISSSPTPQRDSTVVARRRSAGQFPWAGYAFLASFVLALFAFWPEYLSKLPGGGFYWHLHAILMTLWFGLLITQPLLIRAGNRPLHRLLGKTSFALAPLAIVSILLLAHARIREFEGAPAAVASAFASHAVLPLSLMMLFAISWALAIHYRRNPALHARYMICTGLAFIDPIGSRLLGYYGPPLPDWAYQGTTFALTDLLLIWLIWRERDSARGRAAFPAMLAVAAVLQISVFVLPEVPAWQSFMQWFAALPLT